ncbi:L,D-transpeptidase family protein [Streptomyces humi]|uniref:L,D-transpeptidase family protein n=1 Tax=Streptomyces humi TaxID=1428620 RepID=UPI000628897A|nr:L,D-transpeptidase family protein [Streptomyces humi]
MRLRRPHLSASAALVVSALGIAAYLHLPESDPAQAAAVQDAARAAIGQQVPAPAAPRATARPRPHFPARLPGVGPKTLAQVPADTRQVLLVTGAGRTSATAEAVLWQRVDGGWRPGAVWAAHNGYRGWTDEHYAGDLHSPVGVFGLTDAGGRLADPGTKLPYHRSGAFSVSGTGFEGEPLSGAFDYVIAINYNRQPGTSPMDGTQPMGANRGGGIWIHVDHGGPTHACVSLSKSHMRQLLRALEPADHPVVVMGDVASLAR